MGSFSAQLAAGAMSAMHVSAGVQGNGTQSNSIQHSCSETTNRNYSA